MRERGIKSTLLRHGPAGPADDSDISTKNKKVAAPGVEPAPAAKRVQTARSLIFLLKKGGFFAVRGL